MNQDGKDMANAGIDQSKLNLIRESLLQLFGHENAEKVGIAIQNVIMPMYCYGIQDNFYCEEYIEAGKTKCGVQCNWCGGKSSLPASQQTDEEAVIWKEIKIEDTGKAVKGWVPATLHYHHEDREVLLAVVEPQHPQQQAGREASKLRHIGEWLADWILKRGYATKEQLEEEYRQSITPKPKQQ